MWHYIFLYLFQWCFSAAVTDNSNLHESPVKHIEWRIPNFLELPTEVDYKLDSDVFPFLDTTWFLRIYPNGETLHDSIGWIGMYLMRNEFTEEHHVNYRIGVVKADGSDLAAATGQSKFPNKTGIHGYGDPKRIDRSIPSLMNDAATDGTLTVFCTYRIMDRSFAKSVNLASKYISSLLNDFKNIYMDERFTDVKLIVRNEEFEAHKTVLIARSSVFASMFGFYFLEVGKVEILDCDPSSFQKFLFFLYAGELDRMSVKEALDLYKLADKYDVGVMKWECVQIIRRNLCIDIFCDVFHLAMMYSESDLLKDVQSFFIDNAEEILSTTKWQQFLEENPSFCNELLLKLVKSKNLRKDEL